MNELDKFRLKSYEKSIIYKEKIKKWHDVVILKKDFKVRDLVFLYVSRLRLFLGNSNSYGLDLLM